jgi:predicted GNAT family N-acyltransferase
VELKIEVVEWARHQAELMRIREAVFVQEQGVPAELEHDEHDSAALHLLAQVDAGKPVATARMLPGAHIGRMAVLGPWRRQGIGSALLRELVRLAAAAGYREVYLHAQCHAEDFYQRLGFVAQGPVFEDAGIPHRRMVRTLTATNNTG